LYFTLVTGEGGMIWLVAPFAGVGGHGLATSHQFTVGRFWRAIGRREWSHADGAPLGFLTLGLGDPYVPW